MSSLIGIVTVLFNSDEVLPGFFQSLACQRDVKYRLYVIDNSKSDSGSKISQKLADIYGIDAKILFNDANVGVAKGNNQGIEMALTDGCEYILLSNNDVVFNSINLISGMINASVLMKVDAVVPKIYYYDDPDRIWCAGGRFLRYAARTPHFGDGMKDSNLYQKSRIIDYAPTCFILMHQSVFVDVGRMDERYFVYFDDTDFLWRMKASGKRLYYWSQGSLWHKVSFSTGGGESLFSLYYIFRNRIYFIRKHYSFTMKFIAFLYISLTLFVKIFRFDSERRRSVLKGIRDGFLMSL
jgi:GT2 family glycosyltransferase